MLAGLAAYEAKFHIKPTARALFDWLADSDETGIIEDYNQKSDTIIWRGATGKFHDTSFKAFEGRFTKIKKSRVYPG